MWDFKAGNSVEHGSVKGVKIVFFHCCLNLNAYNQLPVLVLIYMPNALSSLLSLVHGCPSHLKIYEESCRSLQVPR